MIYYHNSNYPEIIRFRQEFFKKHNKNNKHNKKIRILRPLQLLLSTNCCCFLYFPPLLSFFFRLRTQLIAGSLISLCFYYSPLFLWWKNDIKSYMLPPAPSFIITNPLSSIDPPTINCFYMKKPVSSHNIIITILVILSYKNKTKRKNIHEEKTLMTTFSYMNKTTKVILLSTFVYHFLSYLLFPS